MPSRGRNRLKPLIIDLTRTAFKTKNGSVCYQMACLLKQQIDGNNTWSRSSGTICAEGNYPVYCTSTGVYYTSGKLDRRYDVTLNTEDVMRMYDKGLVTFKHDRKSFNKWG